MVPVEAFVFSTGYQPHLVPYPSPQQPASRAPQGVHPPLSSQILETLANDTALIEALRPSLLRAEIEGLNDAIGDFKRESHRGQRAEQQVWPLLGPRLLDLGFSHRFENNQGRFFSADRYPWPVRLLYCRAQEVDGEFTVWRKGECAQELFNDNKRQLQMFPPVSQHSSRRAEPLDGVVWNVWILPIIERVRILGNLYDEELVVHFVYPLSIQKRTSVVARYHLQCDARREIFRESLGQAPMILGERPEAQGIVVPEIEERDFKGKASS